jgi:hypothetical protein
MHDAQFHVLPVNDLREHDETLECWCKPEIQEDEGATIVVHNSMDGRGKYETGERHKH